MKRLKLILGLLLVLCPIPLRASDINIFPTGPVYRLTGLQWGTSTVPGFNNNYFFTPLNLNESVCVYVRNNNPTNPHTFTASIIITPDPNDITPGNGNWPIAATSQSLFTAAAPGLPAGVGAQVSGVAQVSINLSASTVQAGSPDTANVTIVQTTGNCFAGGQMISSAPQNVAAVTPFQIISEGLSQAYAVQSGAVTNPAGGTVILHLNANSGKAIYYDRITFSCSAACTITVNTTQALGGTCSTNTATPAKILFGATFTTTARAEGPCSVAPATINSIFLGLPIAAGIVTTIDLRGFTVPSGTTGGIDLVMQGALTGTINATFFWYEK